MHQELHSMRRANSEPQRHILERLADKVSKSCDLLCLDVVFHYKRGRCSYFGRALAAVGSSARRSGLYYEPSTRGSLQGRPPSGALRAGTCSSPTREISGTRLCSALTTGLPCIMQTVPKQDTVCAAQNDRTLFEGGSAEEALKVIPEELNPGNLKISWNRQLAIPGQSNGFAQFHFDDLCRKPLAAEDFLIIASNFHTVFLHDVPKLTLEEHNEARRFTNLVDALYEHSSAAHLPLSGTIGGSAAKHSGASRCI